MTESPRGTGDPAQDHYAIASICQMLGQWVANLHEVAIPEDIQSQAKLHLLDTLGALLAGTRGEEAQSVLGVLRQLEGDGPVRILQGGPRTTLLGAVAGQAALNGLAEMDDIHASAMRPGAMVVPVLLSLAQVRPLSGRDLLLGMVAGYEVGLRIGAAMDSRQLLAQGFWPSSILGPLSSSAAAAKVMGLSTSQAAHALAIAGLMAGGLVTGAAEGPTGRHLVFGYAARTGTATALAAEAGLTGPMRLFEDRRGLFNAFGHGDAASEAVDSVLRGLGQRFELSQTGFKLYPCARQTHAALDALETILAEHHLCPDDMESIEVSLAPATALIVDKPDPPQSRIAALAGVQFVLAALAVHGQIGHSQLSAEGRADQRVLELQRRIRVQRDEGMAKISNVPSARVRVLCCSGENWEATVMAPRGDVNNPATQDMVRQKFLEQAEPVLGADKARQLISLVDILESLPDAYPILAALNV